MVHGSAQTLVGIVAAIASLTAVAAPVGAAQPSDASLACTAQSTPAGLDVSCPSATVAQLLSALRQATGLRSEYPRALADARVSVALKRPSLLEVLESALSAFNFAVWTDEKSPAATWVTILDARGVTEHAEAPAAQAQAGQHKSRRALQEVPGPIAPVPSHDEAQMAEARESFAASVASTPEVEPIPVVTSPVVMPGVEAAR